jgi:hypothetical protein|tara:strand:- start:112 stop:1059 length:948 start_codon:yes stop_codon:yes gene_type:complete
MKSNEYSTCYVISFWLGDRRRATDVVKNDKLWLLKKQIEILQTTKHNFNKIIFNFNVETEHYHYLSEIFEITPKSIQGADIEINIRKNYGISYSAWSDVFSKYKSKYDYYVFTEDDYFFIENNWDTYLIDKHNSYDDCGYLCMMIREPQSWNNYRKIAGSSVGIASSETLMKLFVKYGKLPSLSEFDDTTNEYDDMTNRYVDGHDIQNKFGFSFVEIGLNIYDVRDDYQIMFSKSHQSFENVNVWTFFNWNKKFLNVPAEYFNGTYYYYDCHDLEFQQEYKLTTNKEAIYCYDNHKTYYDENSAEWFRREYPKNL